MNAMGLDFSSLEFWMTFQLFFDLILVVLIIRAFKSVGKTMNIQMPDLENTAKEAVEQMIATIEPVLKEAEKKSKAFSEQISEKNERIIAINESLDKRMISLNLILSKIEKVLNTPPERIDDLYSASEKAQRTAARRTPPAPAQDFAADVDKEEGYNQKEAIIALSEKGLDADTIARKLSLPKGEVELVLELRKKMSGF